MFIRWIGIGNFSDVPALQMMIHTILKGIIGLVFRTGGVGMCMHRCNQFCCMSENEKKSMLY